MYVVVCTKYQQQLCDNIQQLTYILISVGTSWFFHEPCPSLKGRSIVAKIGVEVEAEGEGYSYFCFKCTLKWV